MGEWAVRRPAIAGSLSLGDMANFFNRWFGKHEAEKGATRDVASLVASLASPAIHIVKTDGLSRSYLGGAPNLPPDVKWPERDGKRLAFLARLSLDEIQQALPIEWLPGAGALLFFYDVEQQPWGFDPKDRGSWAVLPVPDLAAPVSAPTRDSKRSGSDLPHRNVVFRRIDVLPSADREAVDALGLSQTEIDRYCDLAAAVFQDAPRHQVAGFPAPLQNDDMEVECQLASHGLYAGDASARADARAKPLEPGATHWRLLFQLESDDDVGVMWGDGGTIYYWVEADAARTGQFDNTWLILQCF